MGTKICLATKIYLAFERDYARLGPPTWTAKYQVDSLRSFIRGSCEYITLVQTETMLSSRHATAEGISLGEGYRVVKVIVSSFRTALSFQTWMRGPCQPRPNEVCQKPLLSATHSEASLVDRVMINDERAILPIAIKHTHIHIQSDTNMYSKAQHNVNIYMIYINIILTMTLSICTKYLSSHSNTSTAHCHSPTEKGHR